MMFGYSNAWWALLMLPAVLWVLFGPFVMVPLGVWCASAPGLRPRLWSVLTPLIPVTTSAILTIFPLGKWDRPRRVDGGLDPPLALDDFLAHLAVYIGGITVLPWLLGYAITHLLHFIRARRRTRTSRPGQRRRTRHSRAPLSISSQYVLTPSSNAPRNTARPCGKSRTSSSRSGSLPNPVAAARPRARGCSSAFERLRTTPNEKETDAGPGWNE
ncbi:hypothetical protein ACWGE1_20905 [Streptomyces sp. NPDC054932]